MGRIARALFGIPPGEVTVERRGFQAGPAIAARLEAIGSAFVAGYHLALEDARPATLALRLAVVDSERRGFAYEGAAMGLAVLDAIAGFGPSRWRAFLDGPGAPHVYMVHVGAGWAMARLGPLAHRLRDRMDPLLVSLAYDGYGFHQGYFHARRCLGGQPSPRGLDAWEARAFDQGLGRSLWFVAGAVPASIEQTIGTFATARHPDLWSGVGLASAYAGGVDRATLDELCSRAGEHAPWLAQGAAFAAKARLRAKNPAPHTAMACEALCAMDAAAAARTTDEALEDATRVPSHGAGLAYQHWRRGVQDRMTWALRV